MPTFPKEILEPGVYYPRTGPVRFTPEDIADFCKNSNALLASGRKIPVPLEHQPTAVPLSQDEIRANRVLHNAGWVNRFYLLGKRLYADVDICNPDAARNLAAIQFVSPEIRPEWEADGRVWKKVITHVALTTQPVHRDQEPFQAPPIGDDGSPVAHSADVALSLAPIRLSMADAVSDQDWLLRSYRVPEGGIWFRGTHYATGSVPKAEVAAASPDQLVMLLRQLSARQKRVAPRAYAKLSGGEAAFPDLPPGPISLPVSSVAAGGVKPLFTPHPDSHPPIAWANPHDGTTHLVSGSLPGEGEAEFLVVSAPDAEAARGCAAAKLAGCCKLDPRDLACAFRHGGLEEISGVEGDEAEAAKAAASIPAESFSGFLDGRLTPAEAAAIGGLRRLSLEDELMAGFMADLDKEDDAAEEKAEGAAEKAEGEEKEEAGEAEEAVAEAGASPQDEELKDAISLLSDLNVDLRGDEIQNAKDLVHHLVIALHAIKKVAGGGEEGADMAAEPLEPVSANSPASAPMPGAAQMSVAVAEDPRFKAMLDQGTKSEYEKICATVIDPLVVEGRCTKAQADQLKSKIQSHRLSLFDEPEKLPVGLVEARAEIRALKQNPQGTFGGADKPAKVQLSVGGDSPSNVLEAVSNPTPKEAPGEGGLSEARLEEIKKELWSNMTIALNK